MATLASGWAEGAGPAPAPINWTAIPTTKVILFYPGLSTYEWLRSPDHKGATREVKRGDSCTSCHDEDDNEQDIGKKIVSGERVETSPIKGKNGFVPLNVQVAYDAANVYFRFQWKTNTRSSGTALPYYRFDGKAWTLYGASQLDAAVQSGTQPPAFEDRLSLMIDDGKVPGFAEQGCWLTCHDGSPDSRKEASLDKVSANAAMKSYDLDAVRKYLPASRSDPSDWSTGKPKAEIRKIMAEGGFVDLVQWLAHRTNPAGVAEDGYILEGRFSDAGKPIYSANFDTKSGLPRFMFNPKSATGKSVKADAIGNKDHILISGDNAMPFDPRAQWQSGDMLPAYVVNGRKAPVGSVANSKAQGVWMDGEWTLVLTRPLNLSGKDDKAFKEGGVYHIGFAVHDDHTATRGHFVSWVRTLGLGASTKTSIQATRLR